MSIFFDFVRRLPTNTAEAKRILLVQELCGLQLIAIYALQITANIAQNGTTVERLHVRHLSVKFILIPKSPMQRSHFIRYGIILIKCNRQSEIHVVE